MSKQSVFTLIIIFFSLVIIHFVYAPLENWPFSSFGMYKSLRTNSDVISLELYQVENNIKTDSFLKLGDYRFYLASQIEKIIKNHYKNTNSSSNSTLKFKINKVLEPVLQSKREKERAFFLKYKIWKGFSRQKLDRPDYDILMKVGHQ